jgi:glycine cleavage system H protein
MTWKTPKDRRYTETDEWIVLTGDGATVGITDYAQDQLSDIVYVELPAAGESFEQGDIVATVESVKAAADVHMPVSGAMTAANGALEDEPEKVNRDPYGAAWFIKVTPTDPAEIESLMDADAYARHCASRDD